VVALSIPARLVAAAAEDRKEWLSTLPATVESVKERWSLEIGEPFEPGGRTAWVAPVRNADGGDLVLKIGWRHHEAAHEADGLRAWDGDGAVHLHAVDEFDDTVVLLLERCSPGTTLGERPEQEQDEVIASLLRRLWLPPANDHPFQSLQIMCNRWAAEFEQKASRGRVRIDPGLARVGMELFRSLPASATNAVLLCTDLHAENVLAAEREPWLVVDPKPFVGDPTYDPLQHMLNCCDRLHADPYALAYRMADSLDLDPERLLLWLFARCVQESPDWPALTEVARAIAPK
jgi:streptomycin 6-kinase